MKTPHDQRHEVKILGAQFGSALIISMLILLVLTIIGITAMRTATLEERMAGNVRDHDRAFQAAESAVRDGESEVAGYVTEPDMLSDSHSNADLRDANHEWYRSQGTQADYGSFGLSDFPYYIVEEHEFVRDTLTVGHDEATGRYFYRVTSSGVGARLSSQVIVQVTYAKRF